ncbi:MAG: DUF192 domain-containing protein [Pseudomonadota bacterium]
MVRNDRLFLNWISPSAGNRLCRIWLLTGLLLLVGTACSESPDILKLNAGGEQFRVEVADTPAKRNLGLSRRPSLAADAGMLFVYAEPNYLTFWMRDTLVDLDILFLDSDWGIVDLATMVVEPPRAADESQSRYLARLPRYRSRQPARYALEVSAGTIERLQLAAGQQVHAEVD